MFIIENNDSKMKVFYSNTFSKQPSISLPTGRNAQLLAIGTERCYDANSSLNLNVSEMSLVTKSQLPGLVRGEMSKGNLAEWK